MKKPGYPCRVCLQDAEPGQTLLLFSYSPFRQACSDQPRPECAACVERRYSPHDLRSDHCTALSHNGVADR
ncbi:MAG: DUF1203 domain-containing protein [Myxococcaceae bacterium]